MAVEAVEAPALIRPEHVQDRALGVQAGAKLGFRSKKTHPLEIALETEKISHDEYAAGEVYRGFYDKMGRSGKDSTDFTIISGNRTPFTDSQVIAIRAVESIETALKRLTKDARWVVIVRRFCGEGDSARDACVKGGIGDPRETWDTIRLVLSKLSTAISRAHVELPS